MRSSFLSFFLFVGAAIMGAAPAPPAPLISARTARPAVRPPQESGAGLQAAPPAVRMPRPAQVRIRELGGQITPPAAARGSITPVLSTAARERVRPLARPQLALANGQPPPNRARTQITTTPGLPTVVLATNVTRRANAPPALSRTRPARGSTMPAIAGSAATPALMQASAGRWWSYLYDNFDGIFPGYWLLEGSPTWGRTSYRAVSTPYSIWCLGSEYTAPHGYFNNMNAWIFDGPFDLRNTTALEIYFDYWLDTELTYDSVFVGVSTDGIDYTGDALSGYSAGWVLNRKVLLNDFAGAPYLYVGVQFFSDNVNAGFEGAYVDNLELDAYIPSDASVDLAVANPHVLSTIDEIFTFDIINYGPGALAANSYAINVFVDGVLDSSARNLAPLASGAAVTWEWQLTYIYPRGPHTIRIEAFADGGDIAPPDNILVFILDVGPQIPVNLAITAVRNIDGGPETFDLDVANFGPGIARAYSYRILVDVDGLADSDARNTVDLPARTTVTWQWQLAYQYPPGDHLVRATVISDGPEITTTNNVLEFIMPVPLLPLIADLRLDKPVVTDAVNDIIWFRVRNSGPDTCYAYQYLVSIFVDGLLDSQAYNQNPLIPGGRADWNWQLAYLYPAGLHVVTIEAMPLGTELTPLNNVASIHLLKKGTTLQIVTPVALTGVVDTAMALPLQAIGGAPPYTWRVAGGTMPVGSALAGDGVVCGVPTSAGASALTFETRDAAGLLAYAAATIVVLPNATGLTPQLLEQIAPVGFVNVMYAAPLTAVGGAAPYTWTELGGMPVGLSLSPAGLCAGTPLVAGHYTMNVALADAGAVPGTGAVHLRIRPDDEFLNGNFTQITLSVPWNKHAQGKPDSDTLKIKANFSVPPRFVLDNFMRGVLYIGGYPLNYNVAKKATWHTTVTFTPARGRLPAAYATIRWTKKNQLTVAMTIHKADLTPMLARYGITRTGATSALIPVRLVLNEADTGVRPLLFSYRLNSATGILRLQ